MTHATTEENFTQNLILLWCCGCCCCFNIQTCVFTSFDEKETNIRRRRKKNTKRRSKND